MPWTGICLLVSLSLASGQLPRRLKECLPYPTFADEVAAEANANQPAPPHIRIRKLVWRGVGVPRPERKEIVAALKDEEFSIESDSGWQREFEERARDELQQHGYFKAKLKSAAHLSRRSNSVAEADVQLYVNPGPQYRLGTVSFSKATAFPYAQLRAAFPMASGEVFDTDNVRKGLEGLRMLYGNKGYINFTPVPDTTIDEATRVVSLSIDIDEGKQYRISQIRILGLDPIITKKLLQNLKLKPGDVYDDRLIEPFFQENKSLLPDDADLGADAQVERNDQDATLGITLDFRGCPAWPSTP
jgi:outer membrane protein insertion porin family